MNLENLNVQEMNKEEMLDVDGGVLSIIIIGVAGLYLAGVTMAAWNGYNGHTGRPMHPGHQGGAGGSW